jgi:carbon monoxide dehydrogenase subunit G
MQLENKFTIDVPIDKAWEAFNTPDMVAPCFPGATLQGYEDDSFTGTVKVKLGPISLTYKGKGTYVQRDDEAHRVVIEASGRDARGNGTAEATVTGSMVADGPGRTAVTMVTDMKITGRPAQFGRGVISDVAEKIIGQFASCVSSKLAPEQTSAPSSSEGAAGAGAGGSSNGSGAAAPSAVATATGPALSSTSATSASTTPKPAATGPMRSEIDAIDLLDTAGAPVLKRLAPVLGGGLLLLIILLIKRSRSS